MRIAASDLPVVRRCPHCGGGEATIDLAVSPDAAYFWCTLCGYESLASTSLTAARDNWNEPTTEV